MRVLHVIESLDPATGGPPAVVLRLASAQAALGHEVTIAFNDPRWRLTGNGRMWGDVPGVERVGEVLVTPGVRLKSLIGRNVPSVLTEQIGRSDVAHMHGVWEPLLLMAGWVARRLGIPYGVTPHGMLDPWSLRQKRWKKRLALVLGYKRMLSETAFLHALNRDEARLIEPLGLRCRVEVVPNGVFLDEIERRPAAGFFYKKHPELEGRPYVLFMSRLHYKKGLDYLAGAFVVLAKRDQGVRLVVAGPDEGERAGFERTIAGAGLASRVHVVGPVYGEDKWGSLVDAACFCLPSRQEGFSVAVTEALACGTPVVISEACHFPEVAEAGAGEVVPLDHESLAGALGRVLSDAGLRGRMGQAGRQLVASRYTWPRIAQRMIEVYQRAKG